MSGIIESIREVQIRDRIVSKTIGKRKKKAHLDSSNIKDSQNREVGGRPRWKQGSIHRDNMNRA